MVPLSLVIHPIEARHYASIRKVEVMGSSQSRLSESELQEQLAQRLKAIGLKDKELADSDDCIVTEKGYVVVDGKANQGELVLAAVTFTCLTLAISNLRSADCFLSKDTPCTNPITRNVSIATTEHWERELLQDPKVLAREEFCSTVL